MRYRNAAAGAVARAASQVHARRTFPNLTPLFGRENATVFLRFAALATASLFPVSPLQLLRDFCGLDLGPFRAKTVDPPDRYAFDEMLVKSGNNMI